MDRFDKRFNDVDVQTGRPFSGGHPDGVWIASIIYGAPIVMSLIAAIGVLLANVFMGAPGWGAFGGMIVGFIISCVVFFPAIIFLFRRSQHALNYALALFVVTIAGCVGAQIANPSILVYALILCGFQGVCVYYFWGLKKDALLS